MYTKTMFFLSMVNRCIQKWGELLNIYSESDIVVDNVLLYKICTLFCTLCISVLGE